MALSFADLLKEQRYYNMSGLWFVNKIQKKKILAVDKFTDYNGYLDKNIEGLFKA